MFRLIIVSKLHATQIYYETLYLCRYQLNAEWTAQQFKISFGIALTKPALTHCIVHTKRIMLVDEHVWYVFYSQQKKKIIHSKKEKKKKIEELKFRCNFCVKYKFSCFLSLFWHITQFCHRSCAFFDQWKVCYS